MDKKKSHFHIHMISYKGRGTKINIETHLNKHLIGFARTKHTQALYSQKRIYVQQKIETIE